MMAPVSGGAIVAVLGLGFFLLFWPVIACLVLRVATKDEKFQMGGALMLTFVLFIGALMQGGLGGWFSVLLSFGVSFLFFVMKFEQNASFSALSSVVIVGVQSLAFAHFVEYF
jgi:membrane-bound metal-dependent hydrolase YbcI (DUF457 family)